ncbi:MAG: vitamin B12 dependent-methionine synthase activation domain-containing protein [Dehalobacterium sp.]
METIIKHLPCEINRERLFKYLHLNPNASYIKRVDKMIEEALKVGKPKIAYKLAYVDSKGEDFIIVEDIKFTSKVLRINLEQIYKVVAYVITSGIELEEWSKNYHDSFNILCADGIKEEVLRCASTIIFRQIDEELNLGKTTDMNPGSLPNWPLTEQEPLFRLIGNVKALIGVELSESCLMSPIKSVSGFRFSTESSYVNCQLCLQENCPGRKAPFDKELYENKYQL